MNRRQLLLGALATTALAATPLAFAGVSPTRRRAMLTEAWDRATRAARPLLVLIIDEQDRSRGRRIGSWLNFASDDDLAPLGLVEPVCATLEELDRLVPGVKDASGAWFVLVRVDQPTATWRSVVVPDEPEGSQIPDFEDWAFEHTKEIEGEVDWERLRVEYFQFIEAHTERAKETRATTFRTSLLRVLASEGLTPDPSTAQVATARARELWVRNAPPGSHWLRPGGCGATIEYAKDEKPDPGRLGLLCGMGHVQPHEQRFLAFYDVLS